jgi:hypothetical protein
MKPTLSTRIWIALILLGFSGQLAWGVENQFFNTFVYDNILPDPRPISWMVAAMSAWMISTGAWSKDLFPAEQRGQFAGYVILFTRTCRPNAPGFRRGDEGRLVPSTSLRTGFPRPSGGGGNRRARGWGNPLRTGQLPC